MMPDYVIRPWRTEDLSALKALWKSGFGDDDEVIDSFFRELLRPGCCLLAEAEGQLVSAMYILKPMTLQLGRRRSVTAGYTYALATLPEYRGQGIGGAVYAACCDEVLKVCGMACVLPAEPGLAALYENANGAKPVSYLREARLTREEVRALPRGNGARFPADRYGGLRENMLMGLPHAVLDADLYDWAGENGTEFFMLENGLAAADTADGVCHIRELIPQDDDWRRALSAVARWCPAEEYIVHTPLFFDGPGDTRPAVLGVPAPGPALFLPPDLWWGLGLE